MSRFIPWDSQPLKTWASTHARGKFILLDGHLTHFTVQGQGDPIILIHGFFFDSHSWDGNAAALAQTHRVYALDLWGFGYSTREPLDYGYPLYTRQLKLFMDALKIERATLIGQSMGAGTIVHFAAHQNPERINKAVLVDPTILPNKLPLMRRIASLPGVGEFLFGLDHDFPRKMTLSSTFIYDQKHITPAYFEQVTRFHKIRGTTEVLLTILRRQFFHTLSKEIRTYKALGIPTLIIGGRQSAAIPIELTRQVSHILLGARLEIYDQAGHCPHDEHPERFNRDVLAFLGG